MAEIEHDELAASSTDGARPSAAPDGAVVDGGAADSADGTPADDAAASAADDAAGDAAADAAETADGDGVDGDASAADEASTSSADTPDASDGDVAAADAASSSPRRRNALLAAFVAVVLVIVCVAIGFTQCSGEGRPAEPDTSIDVPRDASGHAVVSDDREAARVGEVVITEGQVSEDALNYLGSISTDSASAWRSWLGSQGLTSAQFRDQRLEGLVHDEVIAQAAAQLGVEVTDEQALAEYERNRDEYMQRAKDSTSRELSDGELADRWQNAMLEQGYDEGQFKLYVKRLLLENAVADAVQAQGKDWQTWFTEFQAGLSIQKQAAPEDLPYAVDNE